MEKECEICGGLYEATTARQKYCPACRNHPERKKIQMKRNVDASIRKFGTGKTTGREMRTLVCKQCGKEFQYPAEYEKDFCSVKCREQHYIETAECLYCGKNLLQAGVRINPNNYHGDYCSDECREADKWKKAREAGLVQTCPFCNKEFIARKSGQIYCSKTCYTLELKTRKGNPTVLEERECEICGGLFSATNPLQKYCVSCRNQSARKKIQMYRRVKASIQKYGYGGPRVEEKTEYTCKCDYCGKKFQSEDQYAKFCSSECRSQYKVEHATCAVCGKNLFQAGLPVNPNNNYSYYCSEECAEKARWDNAREQGRVRTCPCCKKEFIQNSQYQVYCSQECSRKFASERKAERENRLDNLHCAYCGKQFHGSSESQRFCSRDCYYAAVADGSFANGRQPAAQSKCAKCGKTFVKHGSSILCPACVASSKEAIKQKQKENRVRKKAEAKAKAEEEYIRKNGLCPTCKTPYSDCERMTTNFQYFPIGAKCNKEGLVVSCPKYTASKRKNAS